MWFGLAVEQFKGRFVLVLNCDSSRRHRLCFFLFPIGNTTRVYGMVYFVCKVYICCLSSDCGCTLWNWTRAWRSTSVIDSKFSSNLTPCAFPALKPSKLRSQRKQLLLLPHFTSTIHLSKLHYPLLLCCLIKYPISLFLFHALLVSIAIRIMYNTIICWVLLSSKTLRHYFIITNVFEFLTFTCTDVTAWNI